jgi:hypothetical protein
MSTVRDTRRVDMCASLDYEYENTLFGVLRTERGLTHTRRERFPIVDDCLDALAASGCSISHSEVDYDGELTALLELGDGDLAYLSARSGNAYLRVASTSPAAVQAQVSWLVTALRRVDTDHERVALRLWSFDGKYPTFTRRVFDAPGFDAIGGNYPLAVRDVLGTAFARGAGEVDGLALWYGPPGTGKTTAVRALALAWRSWCDVHVIVDPERLLASPSYLMKVIAERSFEEDLPSGSVTAERRSRLVVLEDAGELLAADARQATGQGLSRILNVADGLLGRGSNTSLLITTNEEIGTLHPAIRRPGRCWMQLRFGRFPGREARAWLAARGVDSALDVSGSRSLAELYALERGETVEESDGTALGFRA